MFRAIISTLSWVRPERRAARAPARRPIFTDFMQMEDRVVPSFGTSGLLSASAATTTPVASVSDGSNLLGVTASQGALLNGLLTALAGPSLTLSVADYNGLASADLNFGSLLGNLQTQLGAASPAAALTANATLSQILNAAASAALTGGNAPAATTLGNAATALAGANGTIKLGDLLTVNLPASSFSQVELKGLDVLTGAVQLFNFKNAPATPTPATVQGADLGMADISSVQLSAVVAEPPVFVVGPAGAGFQSAAVRLKLEVDLIDVPLMLDSGLLNLIDLSYLGTTSVDAAVRQLPLYVEVASGSGTIQAINAVSGAVTLQATPSVANVYLGAISDTVFFDRTRAINPATDLTAGLIGSVDVTVLGAPVLTLNITARASAIGTAVGSSSVSFSSPYPQTMTVGSGATAIAGLVTSLANGLTVDATVVLGTLPILTPELPDTTADLAEPVVVAVLNPLLTGLVDSTLTGIGLGIGEIDLSVLGVSLGTGSGGGGGGGGSPVPNGPIAVGRTGGGKVRLLDPTTGAETLSVTPFPGFVGSVNVATGDVNGDGVADLIAAAGEGGNTHVKVFDGATGAVIRSFFAFPGFMGGVSVASGDVNSDGVADIIVGAGAGGSGGHVKVFDGATGAVIRSFFAFPGFMGGVSVASGDVNSDGVADIIVGAGTGALGGHVKVFDGATGAVIRSFFAFPGFMGSVSVASGDVNSDGVADIIVGAGAGGSGGHVKVFDGATGAAVRSFLAFPGYLGGVNVGSRDLNGDGVSDILVEAVTLPHVKALDGTNPDLLLSSFIFVG